MVTLLIAAVLVYLRAPDAFQNPQFFAEDGVVFFAESLRAGFSSLWEPYAGYLHLVPRLVAYAALILPPAYAPTAYLGAATLLLLWSVALVCSPRSPLPGKTLAAIALVAVPHTGEVFATLTNVQWFLPLGALAIAFARPPAGRLAPAAECLFLVLCAFSGPFAILLLPVFLWRMVEVRSLPAERRRMLRLAGIVGAGALTQAAVLATHAQPPSDVIPYGWTLPLTVAFDRILVTMVPGPRDIALAGAIGLALCLALAFLEPQARSRKLAIAGFLVVTVLAAFWKYRTTLPVLDNTTNGDRYFYAAKVLVVWLLLHLAAGAARPAAATRGLAAAALAGIAWMSATSFTRAPRPDYDWPAQADRLFTGREATFHILPEGWEFTIPAAVNRAR